MPREHRGFHIVVGYDSTEQSELALTEALALAQVQEGVVHIISVIENRSKFADAEARLAELEKQVKDASGGYDEAKYRLFLHTRIGNPAKEIIGLADEADADLIVVGTHGRKGVPRLVLGSVAEKIMRNAHCPVLIMRPTEHRAAAELVDEMYRPEPPCPKCEVTRAETKGAEWWCEDHANKHPHPLHVIGGSRNPRMDDWTRFNR